MLHFNFTEGDYISIVRNIKGEMSMKKISKALAIFTALLAIGLSFSSCNGQTTGAEFNKTKPITVISREPGSGTRGAFIELLKVEVKNADGTKTDKTTDEAIIASKTDVVMTQVANDAYSIGYISLGSLNNTVKALKIEGAEATAANIKNGSYKIQRPFNIAVKGEATGLKKDFIDFILSKQGQKVIEDNKYIKINDSAPDYTTANLTGKLVIAGSSSVTPVMEKLKEAYVKLNPNANIEIQQSDSTTGINAAINGTCDIGMASRELKDTEKASLKDTEIALDGIAIIVNNKNPLSDIASDNVTKIYTGETTSWSSLIS